MKRCPECRRDYFDETLVFCLDDGTRLLDGPSLNERATELFPAPRQAVSSSRSMDKTDAVTAVLPPQFTTANSFKRKLRVFAATAIIVILGGVFLYWYFSQSRRETASLSTPTPKPSIKLYWDMNEPDQLAFINDRAKHIQRLIGDEPNDFGKDALRAIKVEVDDYVDDRDSLSQKPFEEGLRVVYGRASQYAPIVRQAFEDRRVPAALGLYQAMIESEYHDCPEHEHTGGPVGLFQFSKKTAAKYGLTPADYCDIKKQSDAAARHMSDLISDFGTEKSSWTLALLSFNLGPERVREYLRQMRGQGTTERNFWVLLRERQNLEPKTDEGGFAYVPRFFAAAIIGETPDAFGLTTPPLTTLGGS